MPRKVRLFYFSEETLGIREVRGFRIKYTAFLFSALLIALGAIVAFNEMYIDFLGFGHNKITLLTNENRILKEQLRQANRKMREIGRTLDQLAERDNHLRLLVDLPKIDPDTRVAGIGGSDEQYDFGLRTKEAGEVVRTTQATLEKLERELLLQRQSYEEVVKKFEYNKSLFASIPAIKPMNGFYAVNSYGLREHHPVLGIPRNHVGLDIVNDPGTPVFASGDGIVRSTGRTGGGYGIVVVIDHGYGYTTLYAHLSKSLVTVGQRVQRGDKIALSGRTGLVTGPHLHYEVRHHGVTMNPVDYFFDDISPTSFQNLLTSAD